MSARQKLLLAVPAAALLLGGCKLPYPLNQATAPNQTVTCTDVAVPQALQPYPDATPNTPQFAVVVTCGSAAPFTTDQGSLADQGITITKRGEAP